MNMSSEQFYIRKNGVILGPFTPEQLHTMLSAGQLPEDTPISRDKRSWQSAAGLFAPEPPEPPIEPSPESPAEVPESVLPPEPAAALPVAAPEAAMPEAADEGPNTFLRIAGDALSMIWNGGDFLLRLRRRGSNAILAAGVVAALAALGLAAAGAALFASRYNSPPATLWLLEPGFLLGAGLWLWLALAMMRIIGGNNPEGSLAELDFLTAMFGMLNLSGANTLTLALAFFYNARLYALPVRTVFLPGAGMLAVWLFFLSNLLTGIRLNLMGNAGIAPRHATWLGALCLWPLLMLYGGLWYFIGRF